MHKAKGTKWLYHGALLNSSLTITTFSFIRTCLYREIQENVHPHQVSLDLQMRYAFYNKRTLDTSIGRAAIEIQLLLWRKGLMVTLFICWNLEWKERGFHNFKERHRSVNCGTWISGEVTRTCKYLYIVVKN